MSKGYVKAYIHIGKSSIRICLWKFAITYLFEDIDIIFQKLLKNS